MMEITICGRGGQGGVTLAKIIASAYFLKGKYVQAFGVYAAERSGAPIQAFARVDDNEITNHNQVQNPDYLIVLDRTLIVPGMDATLKNGGSIIVNTPDDNTDYKELFPGREVATIDATSIAVSNGLGTRTVPIVNTTMAGAVARVLDLSLMDLLAGLEHLNFAGTNKTCAREAYKMVRSQKIPGEIVKPPEVTSKPRVADLFDDDVGGMPKIKTGSWATRKPERRQLTPPCNHVCPAGNDVQGFVAAVGKENYDKALGIILETSPLPAICGRVCPAPCMETCNRAEYDTSVNVREIERAAAELGVRTAPNRSSRQEKVAVVGSGPAGLSTAYQLAKLGYPVSLYEAGDELGGVMRTGIPAYRLPRDVLDEEIDYILQYDIAPHTGCQLRREDMLRLSREYQAVFVATGLQNVSDLDLGNSASAEPVQGLHFLEQVRQGNQRLDGQRVIVIGGGNTAMDAARSALRIGASEVRVVYRRTRSEMPAIHEEIEQALEEGIILDELVAPVSLTDSDEGPLLTCQGMVLGPPDASGRPRPVADTSPEARFNLRCDLVILALGQSHDISILPEGSVIKEGEALLGLSGAPFFMGGDFATNAGTVSAAIGCGVRAARHIHRTLSGEDLFPPPEEPVASAEAIKFQRFEHLPPEKVNTLSPAERRRCFDEVHLGFQAGPDGTGAVGEALRCLSCGVCNSCDRCLEYCPEGILRQGSEEEGYYFDLEYCKGCGVCMTACPRGAIYMTNL
ncbi:MAG: 2-oxoacid:acceptor oxidoreductase family protein [Gammaproteobacteria bacterium]|nr:2-oxoacid:acceptor oxidoreductase family protein [Gammaproteobacteria bacterium]NNK99684.1 FAD-dependent oxidoreductase [Xanthomonadales bacterium]